MNISLKNTITEEIIEAHKIKPAEYEKILTLLEREPNLVELGIFSAMWNEHCSYKSSKKWLRLLPTTGKNVVQGPGENAGIIDIGDGDCIVFKMESHNHPSYVDPFQGASTGVGGILRDIFAMGARPIAVMNALRFGKPEHKMTHFLVSGVVKGIASYGNAFGVPTIGGELNFDQDYDENCLVNAFAAGLVKRNAIFISKPTGPNLPVVYLGVKTGRDGVGGATMASDSFNSEEEKDRSCIQIGDPFKAKCLLEASLELMSLGGIIAIQDMGAAGLTCSSVEMGAKGDLGILLDLDKVPIRETEMSSYEIMLSETQERMLLVLDPEKKEQAESIFYKWGLDFSFIGFTTEEKRLRIFHKGEEVVNLPIKDLADNAPEYDRPWVAPKKPEPIIDIIAYDPSVILLKLLKGPHLSSRKWVWEQYDTIIQSNSLQTPGGDAGVVRIDHHPHKALAFTSDSTPRYCKADPYEGAKQAVAECWRNLTATGAEPLGATDNLNFGNPESPEIMGEFVATIKGIKEACEILDFPIVSGNVSFYNQTNGKNIAPTPVIAGTGKINDWSKMMQIGFMNANEPIFLLGAPKNWGTHLGQSIYLRDIQNSSTGFPPPVHLLHERTIGHFIRALIEEGLLTAVHDISDGGLAVALAEMAMKGNIGATIDHPKGCVTAAFFGEDQGRYIVTAEATKKETIQQFAQEKNIFIDIIGKTGGEALKLGNAEEIPLPVMKQAYESWFPHFME